MLQCGCYRVSEKDQLSPEARKADSPFDTRMIDMVGEDGASEQHKWLVVSEVG